MVDQGQVTDIILADMITLIGHTLQARMVVGQVAMIMVQVEEKIIISKAHLLHITEELKDFMWKQELEGHLLEHLLELLLKDHQDTKLLFRLM
jgi:hypothetical protein